MGEVKLLLEEFLDIFLQPDGPQVGDTDMMGLDLHLKPGSEPCRAPFRNLNPKLRTDPQETMNDWLQDGVIEPSSSEWASALVPVKKCDNTMCWAVDFKGIRAGGGVIGRVLRFGHSSPGLIPGRGFDLRGGLHIQIGIPLLSH